MRLTLVTVLVLALTVAVVWFATQLGHFGTPPDPNDAREAGILTPEVLRANLKGASDSLGERLAKGEITDEQFHALMAKAANTLLDQVDIVRIPPKKAWEYGEIYITARRWEDAKKALTMAVKAAKGEDRRVNDNLRLARVLTELGDVKGAIKTARSTFNTPDTGAAPILPATLYEIVPAAEHHGADGELARLLEEAIQCEARTKVDPNSRGGKDFLYAERFHIERGWAKVVDLYRSAGMQKESQAAQIRAEEMLRKQATA
jgi:hypothetical protein